MSKVVSIQNVVKIVYENLNLIAQIVLRSREKAMLGGEKAI